MTDITALAQRMRAAAEKAKHAGEAPVMNFCSRIDALNEFQLAACPANVLALVEALEKAQNTATQQGNIATALLEEVTGLRRDIWTYENTVKKLLERAESAEAACAEAVRILDGGERQALSKAIAILRPAGAVAEADGADSECRNQPGMVVAVHIDAGDFVKIEDQVFEVVETDFNDHDVTLWFVGGEVLKCVAGCLVEVVAEPTDDSIQVIEGEGQ